MKFKCVLFVFCGLFCFENALIGEKPNFLFVLTDDQDLLLKGLTPMENTLKMVANKGATFAKAYVNTPICCPSRSTILTGKFLHNTRVVNNSLEGNCSSSFWQKLHEPYTTAAILKNHGYVTFYAGKYLNQYGSRNAGGTKHVPHGYDWWFGLKGNSKYYNYTLSINGTAVFYENYYLTDLIKDQSKLFLKQNLVRNKPFFMMLAPPASHAPFTSAKRHLNRFSKVKALRTPAFNYTSSQKHWLIRRPPSSLPTNIGVLNKIQRNRFRTLLSVDEMIQELIVQLKAIDVLRKTYVIFTSDNGFHIGQFAMPWDKRLPYETDIKIPFLIRGPGIPKKMVVQHPISAVDIAPTLLDLANIEAPQEMDGNSFKKQLFGAQTDEETHILIEYFGEGNRNTNSAACKADEKLSQCTVENWCKCEDARNNSYTCIKHISPTKDFKFCQFYDERDFIEAYDLRADPYELENIHEILDVQTEHYYKNLIFKYKQCRGPHCAFVQ